MLVLVVGESSTGVSRDDYIGSVAKDIEHKMPKVFDLDQVRKQLGFGISPTSVVLLQELERFNKLAVRMARSLAELQRVSLACACVTGEQRGRQRAPHLGPSHPTALVLVTRPWQGKLG